MGGIALKRIFIYKRGLLFETNSHSHHPETVLVERHLCDAPASMPCCLIEFVHRALRGRMKPQIPILWCIPFLNRYFCFILLLFSQQRRFGLLTGMCVRSAHSFEQGQSMVLPQPETEEIDLQHCCVFHLVHGGDFPRWALGFLH